MNNTSLSEIAYPVYRLGVNKPITEGLVTFFYHEKEVEEGTMVPVLRIVDDKSMTQATLSLRRLQLALQEVPLFRIDQAIFFLGDLIKLATINTWFIDSAGKVFNYTKTTRAKLKCHRINRNIPINSGGAIIEAEGITTRFKSLFSPETGMTYVGILHFGKSLILYGFYQEPFDETWRMV